MSRGSRMGQEVGKIAARLGEILGCSTCGTGLAIDIVGARWGEPAHDWIGGAFGHSCAVTKAGKVPSDKLAAVTEIAALLGPEPNLGSEVREAPLGYADSRLPPEHDDEAEVRE